LKALDEIYTMPASLRASDLRCSIRRTLAIRYPANGYPGPSGAIAGQRSLELNPYLHEYGCSKALLSMVTRDWARRRPDIVSAVCSPGCIDTDCEPHTAGFYDSSVTYPNTLPVEMGVVAPMHLLFGPVTSGWSYAKFGLTLS